MRENIFKALDALAEALGLGKSESATETLFNILADAFDDDAVQKMQDVLDESHDEGLCLDMRGYIADSIIEVGKSFR